MINKVVYGNNTLIDLSNDTVTPMSLDEGVTAHDASGNIIIGTATRGLPVGFEYFQTNPNIQAGSIPFVGGLWDRTIYADLWSWVQQQDGYLISESEWQALAIANNGAVPYYSTGDGSTNFRVPALSVWVKGALSVEEIGDYLADTFKSHKHNVSVSLSVAGEHTHTRGTMNITGRAEVRGFANDGNHCVQRFGAGALYEADRYVSDVMANGVAGGTMLTMGFDASRSWTGKTSENGSHTHTVTLSETTQGNEETRPKTIVGIYCVVAFGYVVSNGEVSLESMTNTLERVENIIKTSTNLSTISISSTQPSPFTKVWIKPI